MSKGKWLNKTGHSLETKEKIRASLKGYKHTEIAKANMGLARTGKKHTIEAKTKIGQSQVGEKNHMWKGGKSWQTQLKNHPDYKRAIEVRKDVCDICLIPEVLLTRKLSFDHDHKTGKFRGWLCGRCNSALGFVEDNEQVLQAMINYLDKSKNS